MTATRRLSEILAADIVGYSRLLIGEDEAGTARRSGSNAAHLITLNVNYGFPPTATSTVTILNDRFTGLLRSLGFWPRTPAPGSASV